MRRARWTLILIAGLYLVQSAVQVALLAVLAAACVFVLELIFA